MTAPKYHVHLNIDVCISGTEEELLALQDSMRNSNGTSSSETILKKIPEDSIWTMVLYHDSIEEPTPHQCDIHEAPKGLH